MNFDCLLQMVSEPDIETLTPDNMSIRMLDPGVNCKIPQSCLLQMVSEPDTGALTPDNMPTRVLNPKKGEL